LSVRNGARAAVRGGRRRAIPDPGLIANKVIQKYQTSTCEQLWQQKAAPKPAEEQELIQTLRNDPQMRAAFINKVAAPMANKMFECGLIP
jgi:hypothetical protein